MPFRLLLVAAVCLVAGPTLSRADDRPLTDDERTKLTAAMKADGCSGGSMEMDDGIFEVDDASCADGRRYDLRFDQSFKLIHKEVDDD
jgi:hypothetical protein